MRFRNYLAEQYKKVDLINNHKVILPITTIYILGYKLPELDYPCIKIERNYKDLVNKKIITEKSEFVECLTQDSYIVQVNRITDRYQTPLDKLLSIFEQKYFIDENKIIKEYKHLPDNEDVKIATDILHYTGTNPIERKKIEIEQEAWRTVNAAFDDLKNELETKIIEFKNAITEKTNKIEQQSEILDNQAKALNEKAKELNEKDSIIAELMKKLSNK